MDLWHKFFGGLSARDNRTKESDIGSLETPSAEYQAPFDFDKEGIRVLLFRECSKRGRKLLYDSSTVLRILINGNEYMKYLRSSSSKNLTLNCKSNLKNSSKSAFNKKNINSEPSFENCNQKVNRASRNNLSNLHSSHSSNKSSEIHYDEISNGYGYQYIKEASDAKVIGEMVFGSVALSFKGPSGKLHLLGEPSRILLSRTSKISRANQSPQASNDTGVGDSFNSVSNSASDIRLSKSDTLEGTNRCILEPSIYQDLSIPGLIYSLNQEDYCHSGPSSPFSSTCGSYLQPSSFPCSPVGTPSSKNDSGNSLKSYDSWSSLQKRFLRKAATSLESFGFADSALESFEACSKDKSIYSNAKLGIAVLIETKQEDLLEEKKAETWWFTHEEVLEILLSKFQNSVFVAYFQPSKFISSVYEAVLQFQQDLWDVVCSPCLLEPLWLSLGRLDADKERLQRTLIDSLSNILVKCDIKETNFFISKLLTSILTYHLGWASSVAPSLCFSQESRRKLSADNASSLSCLQPCNALWGQMSELIGSIGYPIRACRTVVVGSDRTLLTQMLKILSYFIRCSQVKENKFVEDRNVNIVTKPTSSSLIGHSINRNEIDRTKATKGGSKDSIQNMLGFDISNRFNLISSANKDNWSKNFYPHDAGLRSVSSFKNERPSSLPSYVTCVSSSEAVRDYSSCSFLSMKNSSRLSKNKLVASNFLNYYEANDVFNYYSTKRISSSALSSNTQGYRNSSKNNCPVIKISSPHSVGETKGNKVVFTLGDCDDCDVAKSGEFEFCDGENNILRRCHSEISKSLVKKRHSDSTLELFSRNILRSLRGLYLSYARHHYRSDSLNAIHFKSRKEFCSGDIKSSFNTHVSSHIFVDICHLTQRRVVSNFYCDSFNVNTSEEMKYLLNKWQDNSVISQELEGNIVSSDPLQFRNFTYDASDEVIPSLGFCEGENQLNSTEDGSNVSDIPCVSLENGTGLELKVVDSFFGGVHDRYHSIYVLQAITSRKGLEEALKIELNSRLSLFTLQPAESVAIVADMNSWSVELFSSNSFSTPPISHSVPSSSWQGASVTVSHLVSEMCDSLLSLIKLRTSPEVVISLLENHLRGIYLKSQLLSEYLIEKAHASFTSSGASLTSESAATENRSLYDLSELTEQIDVNLNDLPLLLSVASTHTPALTKMFGLTSK